MSARIRILPIVIFAGLGAGALAMLPAHDLPTAATAAEAPVLPTSSVGTANPELLKTLDEALKPPKPQAEQPIQTATAESDSTQSAIEPQASAVPVVATTEIDDPAPTTPAPDATNARIRSAVNLRSGPSSGAGRLSVLQAGEAVSVDDSRNGWVHVTTSDGRSGWIYNRFLSTSGTTATATSTPSPAPARSKPTADAPRAVVSGNATTLTNRTARVASALPAQSRPVDGAPSIFYLQPGQRVRITEVRGEWMKVATADGVSGWIRRAD